MPDNNQMQMPDWLASAMGIGGGLGQAAGGAYNMFGKYNNPGTAASNKVGEIPGAVSQYYSPYMDAGKGAMGDLQNRYKDLFSGNLQNQLGENYKESPGYQFKLKQAMTQGTNAAAAGGMAGSPMHQQNAMQMGNDMAAADYNDYIKNQMGLYGMGLEGEQGLNQMGYNANSAMADATGTSMGGQAAYNFMGQQGANQRKSQSMSNLFSGLGGAAASLFGGPMGGNAWQGLMGLFGGHGRGN